MGENRKEHASCVLLEKTNKKQTSTTQPKKVKRWSPKEGERRKKLH